MKFIKFGFIWIFIGFSTSLECFWNSCHYAKFSSKSPYNSLRGDIRDNAVDLDGCEVISVWTIIRHGKRFPSRKFNIYMKDALSLRDNLKFKKGRSLCAQDVENLINWRVDNELFASPNSLTEEGYQEMFGIGKRLREAYKHILYHIENRNYTIQTARAAWLENSVDGFVNGLSNNKELEIHNLTTEEDGLAIYFRCPKYMEIRRHPYAEYNKYLLTDDYLETKHRLENLLSSKLTDDNITALYDLCRYSWSAIDDKPSPWCALFTKQDFEVLEYAGDLRHYYRNAYGHSINVKMGEIILAELYTHFKKITEGLKEDIRAYFSHGTMLDMIISAIGAFKDEVPLTGTSRDPNRKWKTSSTSIFGTNIIATLYKCGNDYKVGFYLNEEPLTSMCDNGICTWLEFENTFLPFLDTTLDLCVLK